MSSRIFVLNAAGHDFTATAEYTTQPLIIVTEGNVPVFSSDRLHYLLDQRLAAFRAQDYLLLSGTPLLAMLAVLVIKERTNLERINILLWSARTRRYIRRTVSLRGAFALPGGQAGHPTPRTARPAHTPQRTQGGT